MENQRAFVLLCLLCLAGVALKLVQGDGDQEEEEEESQSIARVFSPSTEWQPLGEDEAIPRGLHVRLNLETGEREAKLLDPDEHAKEVKDQGLSVVAEEDGDRDSSPAEPRTQGEADVSELKRIMERMMAEGIGDVLPPPTSEDLERVKRKFRSYSELKKELRGMETEVKTDAEILAETLEEYQELGEEAARERGTDDGKRKEAEEQILNFLEYLVHQIDNAQDFIIRMNGYKGVILPSLNSTYSSTRSEALRLLASAAQNNPRVQESLVSQGAVSVILRLLSSDPSTTVKTVGMYALSCLLRGSPRGQAVFLDKGGLAILIKQFQSDDSEQLKRQLKTVTLIRDLMVETRDAEDTESRCEGQSCLQAMPRGSLYRSLMLRKRLEEESWCDALLTLLTRLLTSVETEISEDMKEALGDCAERLILGGASGDQPWLSHLGKEERKRVTRDIRLLVLGVEPWVQEQEQAEAQAQAREQAVPPASTKDEL